MEGERRLKILVGAFVVLCFGVFAMLVLSLSAERGFFDPRYRLVAHFENVLGLQANAPVWLAGREVGRVERVSFAALGSPRPIEVELRIDSDGQRWDDRSSRRFVRRDRDWNARGSAPR